MTDRAGLSKKVMVVCDPGHDRIGLGLSSLADEWPRDVRLKVLTVAEARALIEVLGEAVGEATRDLGAELRATKGHRS